MILEIVFKSLSIIIYKIGPRPKPEPSTIHKLIGDKEDKVGIVFNLLTEGR